MFRAANAQVPRAKPKTGTLVPVGIPHKGLNTRTSFSAMDPNEAISLRNVSVEAYGLRTRKGYNEWATGLPTTEPVHSILSYYPAIVSPGMQSQGPNNQRSKDLVGLMMVSPRSGFGPGPGTIFAAQGNDIFNVTTGGPGPWTPEVGIVTTGGPYWNGVNYQNVAGSFLLIANENGGYAIYNGTTWSMPSFGTGTGQVSGIDPANIINVCTWKERVWFVEKASTRAWYLPAGQITGVAKAFDFGNQYDHGGAQVFLGGWTIDGGQGIDDYLVSISSQGDVVLYKGIDPDTADTFQLHGTWYSGPLPAGLRAVDNGGGDIYILTQLGLMPLSKLLQPTYLAAQTIQHLSFDIDPLIATLMRQFSGLLGWAVIPIPKEEFVLIRIPDLAGTAIAESFLAFKTTTQTWSAFTDLPYASIRNIGPMAYAGTLDGRVVRAFDGPLDDVTIANPQGRGIHCRVTPAYNPMKAPGIAKRVGLVRPFFLCSAIPAVTMTLLTNYGGPTPVVVPTLPTPQGDGDLWDTALWDEGIWSGSLQSVHSWFGAAGWGFTITVQLDYIAGGDTILMGLDYWILDGGVM